jgi:hypothetical protein
MTNNEKFNLPKKLEWALLSSTSGTLEFDCPRCLQKNAVNSSIFNTKTHQDSEKLSLLEQKFGYTDKGLVILGNIIAFGITALILFGFLGDLIGKSEYSALIYLIGVPVMFVLARFIILLFRKTLPVWIYKCKNCGEWIILSSNGVETHLARNTSADKESKQETTTPGNEQASKKRSNEAALWDLKNGDKKAKRDAALRLINSRDPNAMEIILEQALKEDAEPESKSFLATSIKDDLLMELLINIKKIRTPESVNACINVLSSGDEKVINHAISMLGNLASKKAIEPLEKLQSEGYSGLKPGVIEKTITRIKKKNGMPVE